MTAAASDRRPPRTAEVGSSATRTRRRGRLRTPATAWRIAAIASVVAGCQVLGFQDDLFPNPVIVDNRTTENLSFELTTRNRGQIQVLQEANPHARTAILFG